VRDQIRDRIYTWVNEDAAWIGRASND